MVSTVQDTPQRMKKNRDRLNRSDGMPLCGTTKMLIGLLKPLKRRKSLFLGISDDYTKLRRPRGKKPVFYANCKDNRPRLTQRQEELCAFRTRKFFARRYLWPTDRT